MADAASPRPESKQTESPELKPDRVTPALNQVVDIFAEVASDLDRGLSRRNGFSEDECRKLGHLCMGITNLAFDLDGNELYRFLNGLENMFIGRMSSFENTLRLVSHVERHIACFNRIERDEALIALKTAKSTKTKVEQALAS